MYTVDGKVLNLPPFPGTVNRYEQGIQWLNPERLGQSTTVNLRIQVAPGSEPIPPPLMQAQVRYPAGLDPQLSGLGIDACTAATLETAGVGACPPDSVMGEGQAIAEF
jgi:hypothetical protein